MAKLCQPPPSVWYWLSMLIRSIFSGVSAFTVIVFGLKPDIETRTVVAEESTGTLCSVERTSIAPATTRTTATTMANRALFVPEAT